LRRFFIDIASRFVSFLTRRLRLGPGVGCDIMGPPPPPPPPIPIMGGASIIGGAAIIIVEGASIFFSTVFVELSVLVALLLAEPDPALLADAVELDDEEFDEELPTLLIVTLLTLRVPVLAAIRIRRVFSSAADITLLEYYI